MQKRKKFFKNLKKQFSSNNNLNKILYPQCPSQLVFLVVSKLFCYPSFQKDQWSWSPIYITSNARTRTNNPIDSFEMFLIPLCFQNRPKNISTSALYWNEKIKYLQLHLGWKIFPEKMYFFPILASWMLIYEHDIHIYIYTCIDTYKYKLRGTHRGNGLILFLCCAFERLPLFFHHLLSTAQRVPLSRQFRVLHRGVCT